MHIQPVILVAAFRAAALEQRLWRLIPQATGLGQPPQTWAFSHHDGVPFCDTGLVEDACDFRVIPGLQNLNWPMGATSFWASHWIQQSGCIYDPCTPVGKQIQKYMWNNKSMNYIYIYWSKGLPQIRSKEMIAMKEQRGERPCTHQTLMHQKEEAGTIELLTMRHPKTLNNCNGTIITRTRVIQRVNHAKC